MLYNLLINYSDTYSFLNFFNFLTVRTGLAVITSMIIVFIIGDRFINFFSAKKITNPIRLDGPEEHLIKKRAAWFRTWSRIHIFGHSGLACFEYTCTLVVRCS